MKALDTRTFIEIPPGNTAVVPSSRRAVLLVVSAYREPTYAGPRFLMV